MAAHGVTPLASFWTAHGNVVGAIVAVVVAVLAAIVVERGFSRHGGRIANRIVGGELTPVADTRLRFVRRLTEAAIVLIGVAIALTQFSQLHRIANSLLASSALAAAVLGFAARQTLANAIAGLLLAITQPLRIGDEVCFEGESGTVEDVRLTYTYLRTGAGARVIIPNERLASGVLRNDTILEPTVATDVSVWLAPDADAARGLDVLRAAIPDAAASIAEVATDGTRLSLTGEAADPSTRGAREDELRAQAYAALRGAGLR